MAIKTITLSSEEITKCKCGNYPRRGAKFWYKSRYGDGVVEGLVENVRGSVIISSNGVVYNNHDIEVEDPCVIREEKLNNLGIKDE